MNVPPKQKTRMILIGLLLGLLLSSLDQTIMSTAMPTVIRDLGGFTLYSWVFSIYMLTSTISMPIYGKLADLYGRRKLLMTGLVLFIIGSALCGFATNMTELIIFRGIQGLGGGALMPLSIVIIGDLFAPEKRAKLQGIFGAVFGLASILGPMVGGWIVEHLTWNWIFYVNLPFGVAAIAIIGTALKESRSNEKKSIDWLGALTLSGALVAILLALQLGGNTEQPGTHFAWGSLEIISLFSAGAVLLALFVWIESKAKEPLIPLPLFRNRVVTSSNAAGFLVSAALFGAITYIPLFVQGVIGVNPSLSGYIMTPFMLAVVTGSILGGRFMSRISFRTLIIGCMAIMAIGFTLMTQMDVNTTKTTIILLMILTGLGMGPMMPAFSIAIQQSVTPQQRGIAMSLNPFFRTIGGAIGVAVMGTLMSARMNTGLTELGQRMKDLPADQLKKFANPQLLLDVKTRATIPADLLLEIQKVFSHSVNVVFIIGVILVLFGVLTGFGYGKLRMEKPAAHPVNSSDSQKPVHEVDLAST